MNSDVSSDKMRTTGIVLSWLTGSAAIGMLVFSVGFICSNATPGSRADGPLARLVNGGAPYLSVAILAAEAAALVLLLVGVARWPTRIIRSPRWILSAFGVLFVAAAILFVVRAAVVIAISPA